VKLAPSVSETLPKLALAVVKTSEALFNLEHTTCQARIDTTRTPLPELWSSQSAGCDARAVVSGNGGDVTPSGHMTAGPGAGVVPQKRPRRNTGCRRNRVANEDRCVTEVSRRSRVRANQHCNKGHSQHQQGRGTASHGSCVSACRHEIASV
jgi:hypothetical protein